MLGNEKVRFNYYRIQFFLNTTVVDTQIGYNSVEIIENDLNHTAISFTCNFQLEYCTFKLNYLTKNWWILSIFFFFVSYHIFYNSCALCCRCVNSKGFFLHLTWPCRVVGFKDFYMNLTTFFVRISIMYDRCSLPWCKKNLHLSQQRLPAYWYCRMSYAYFVCLNWQYRRRSRRVQCCLDVLQHFGYTSLDYFKISICRSFGMHTNSIFPVNVIAIYFV